MPRPQDNVHKAPARVLGCLRPGHLTVLVGYGLGMADGGIPHDLPMDIVPFGLRMPNAEFTVVMDKVKGEFIAVERQGGDRGKECLDG